MDLTGIGECVRGEAVYQGCSGAAVAGMVRAWRGAGRAEDANRLFWPNATGGYSMRDQDNRLSTVQ